jgi:hypothetical protein
MNLPKYSPGAPTQARETQTERNPLLNSINDYLQQPSAQDPMATQVGGDHYKNKTIQPVEFSHANNLGYLEGCIIKRITRWREKDGIKDLEKIKHEVDLLIAMEKKYGRDT